MDSRRSFGGTKFAGMSPYNYAFNNPVMWNDLSGASPGDESQSGLWFKYNAEDGRYGFKWAKGASSLEEIKADKEYSKYDLTGDVYQTYDYNDAAGMRTYLWADGSYSQFERTTTQTISGWFGFGSNGHYRNEYSSGGFGDAYNYIRFLDNASASIYNFGLDIGYSFKNFSFQGVADEASAIATYHWDTPFAKQVNDTKNQFKSVFSDIKFYENIAGALMTANAANASRGIVNITNPETITFYHGTSLEGAASMNSSGIKLSLGNPKADFGQGFYLTTNSNEALSSAARIYGSSNSTLVKFSVPISKLNKLSTYNFSGTTSTWETFINFNKRAIGVNNIGNYDVITGPLFGRIKSTGQILQYGNRTQTAIFTPKAVNLFNKYMSK